MRICGTLSCTQFAGRSLTQYLYDLSGKLLHLMHSKTPETANYIVQKLLLYSSHAVGALTVTAVRSSVVKSHVTVFTCLLASSGFGKQDGTGHSSD